MVVKINETMFNAYLFENEKTVENVKDYGDNNSFQKGKMEFLQEALDK